MHRWAAIFIPCVLSLPPGALAQGMPGGRFGPPWPYDTSSAVHLDLPDAFDPTGGFRSPGARHTATVMLAYPAMQPWSGAPAECRSWCDGKVMMVLTTGDRPALYNDAWALTRAAARSETEPNPAERLTRISAAPDYTEAWERVRTGPPLLLPSPAATSLYLLELKDGTPTELASCITRIDGPGAIPSCTVQTFFDANPALQVKLVYATSMWPQHRAIRAAAMRLLSMWVR